MKIDNSIEPISDVGLLEGQLLSKDTKYLLNTSLPAKTAFIKFSGKFNSQNIVWNACIETMERYAETNPVSDDPEQFIDIQLQGRVHYIHIGLNLPFIDNAAIERSIIMIRNYKRLRVGRHEYGARSKTL